MDESYCNTKHHARYTRFDPSSGRKNEVACGQGAGDRLIIVHACTRDGLLTAKVDGKYIVTPPAAKHPLSVEWPSAELIFKGFEDPAGDYHRNMVGTTWRLWFRNRFFPAFRKLYPGKAACLILDNAKYHRCRADSWVDFAGWRKADLVEWLLDHGCTEILCSRKAKSTGVVTEVVLPVDAVGGGQGVPLVKELLALARNVADVGGTQRLSVDDIVAEASARDGVAHRVVWLPPYTSKWNPIEMVWARAKHQVHLKWTGHRTMTELREQVVAALYNGDDRTGCTPTFIRSCAVHCEEAASAWVAADGRKHGLAGNIRALDDGSSRPGESFIIQLEDWEGEDEADDVGAGGAPGGEFLVADEATAALDQSDQF